MDTFVEYWIFQYTQRAYYPYYRMFPSVAKFLENLDKVIHRNVRQTVPGSNPPRFVTEWRDAKTLLVHYKSQRGLVSFAVALIKALGKYFKEPIEVKLLNNHLIEVKFLYDPNASKILEHS